MQALVSMLCVTVRCMRVAALHAQAKEAETRAAHDALQTQKEELAAQMEDINLKVRCWL